MKDRLVINTEIAAYFIWEYTGHSTPLDLWYCAEDIAFFFEKNNIYSLSVLKRIMNLPKDDLGYVEFIRNVAFRIHAFTLEHDSLKNWFVTERLINNQEWATAIINIAQLYKELLEGKGKKDTIDSVRSQRIRKHFISE